VRSAAGMNMLETCEKSAAEVIDGVTSDSLWEETLAPFIASGAVKPIRSVTSQQRSSHTNFDAECMWRHLVPSPHGVTWRVESVGSFYMYLHRDTGRCPTLSLHVPATRKTEDRSFAVVETSLSRLRPGCEG
jgi:hypothetical protein